MRKLASIQVIKDIQPIPNADSIDVATVLGWHCVVKKGEFNIGDKVVYIEVDSVLPEAEWSEFMRDRHFKVKTIKLRKQVSQGLVMPLSILPNYSGKQSDYREDFDVTLVLGITKFEPPEITYPSQKQSVKIIYPKWFPQWLTSIIHKTPLRELFRRKLQGSKTFPSWIPNTDETRVQVLQPLLDKYKGTKCYITEKVDGSSITIYLKDGKFGVCSRNIDLAEEEGNVFWDTVRQMGIEEKMRGYSNEKVNWALQGELLGEGIQGNKLKIKGHTIRFFNAFLIDRQEYESYFIFTHHIKQMKLETVPILSADYTLDNNIDTLVELAKGKSQICSTAQREGIVIRPLEEIEDSGLHCQLVRNRISFKAINQDFLLKYND